MKNLSNYTVSELTEELRNRGRAVVTWSTEDVDSVIERYFDDDDRLTDNPLTEEDKVEIIRQVDHNHDCNYGITWEHLQIAIEAYLDGREEQ